MKVIYPSPARQRLYTTVSSYTSTIGDILLGRMHEGDDVARLEEALRKRLDVPHVLALNQARLGIYLALKAVLTEKRRKVILSPFTIFDVINMVACSGAELVFADVDPASCTIDPAEVENLIDDETAAVLVTHTYVMCPGWERIRESCRSHGAILIEDAAIAFGTNYNGRPVGTLGDVGIYSFGLFKNVSAWYGGALVTHDPDLFERIAREVRGFGNMTAAAVLSRMYYGLTIDLATNPLIFRALTFWVFRMGMLNDIELINKRTANDPNPFLRDAVPDSLKVRLSPMQARTILSQLNRVEPHLQKRVEIARLYHEGLRDLPGVLLPPMDEDGADGFIVFAIQVPDRAALLVHLMKRGRDCASYFYKNCADYECFAGFYRDCPNARAATDNIVLLPTYPAYGLDEARKNIADVRSFFGKS